MVVWLKSQYAKLIFMNDMQIDNNNAPPLLPRLCEASSILGLVLVGELLALVLVLANAMTVISWAQFGSTSMVVQWVVLSSAAILCQLRPLFNRLSATVSGCLAYAVCLLVAGLVLYFAEYVRYGPFDIGFWAKSMLIAAIFSGIVLRYLYLHQQLNNQQQAELRSRLQSLQARIRPHFLFNAMNTIASLISINPKAAEKAVENLSDLFRSSLQDVDLVALEEEIKICRRYIEIEQMRLADRLSMVWQIPESIPVVTVPSLLLQPLLENAICHGIQRLPEGGKITLNIRQVESQVVITIDNPIPVLPVSQTDQGNHIALVNIKHRLQLHYQDKADLTIEQSHKDQLFRITMKIPMNSVQE